MPTYREIVEYVRRNHGRTVNTSWIAHVKELNGLKPRRAPNRIGDKRANPCPQDVQPLIEEAMQHFGMIP
ncbi:hypothetical protein J7K50_08690 [bacterium]|nr:hypothetical protein [bacterium]